MWYTLLVAVLTGKDHSPVEKYCMNTHDYEHQAERFLIAFNEEHCEYGAGIKSSVDFAAIYRSYNKLFELDRVKSLIEGRSTRQERYLAQFAAFGFVEHSLHNLTEDIADREARATIEWDGGEIPYRQACFLAANEPDRTRRRALEDRVAAAAEETIPLNAQRIHHMHQAAASLGFSDSVEMCDDLAGLDLKYIESCASNLIEETAEVYRDLLESHLRDIGIAPAEATTTDYLFRRRGEEFDDLFPADVMVSRLHDSLSELGIDMPSQPNVTLDLSDRPQKSLRAFCTPIRVPEDIRLVLRPRGGHEDYLVLFHEAGHAEHLAHVKPEVPFCYRYLGDDSVTEAFAFLLGQLPRVRGWLNRRASAANADDYRALARLVRLHQIRKTAAKLLYELKLHRAADLNACRAEYAEILEKALFLRAKSANFLADTDDFFYSARYLRAWMLEVQLRARLVEQFGPMWFTKREAGDSLKDFWAFGQEFTADELAQRLGYPGLQVEPLIEDILSDEDDAAR